ncbi:polysaccharide deacetylase [Candidatus Saccharibacteria bacterium]|nr:polysaccharide deacetylase [Candidatus Saccharibacteria bacterium]
MFFIFFFSTRSSNTPAATASSLPTITSPERTPLAEITSSAEISESGQKVIYLTFDDGPGPYTAKLLDILKKYDVKVTFFVTGAGDDELIAREYNEGHTVGLHTYTHDYAYVYSSLDNFFTDLYEIQTRVKNITGQTSTLTRFPGGSSNLISARYDGGIGIMSRLSEELPARGFTYFDWNISSGDAGGATTSSEVYQNVINALSPNYSVVLQHDIKDFSVDAVEDIIKYGKANGYTFKKLDAGSFAAHHGINN